MLRAYPRAYGRAVAASHKRHSMLKCGAPDVVDPAPDIVPESAETDQELFAQLVTGDFSDAFADVGPLVVDNIFASTLR